jgi:hypothetical protein
MKACPPAGSGIHAWLYHMANRLHDEGFDADTAERLLTEQIREQDPARKGLDSEMRRTMRHVWQTPCVGHSARFTGLSNARPTFPKATPHWQRIADVVKGGMRLADLWEVSPVRIDEDAPDTEGFIDLLFPGNPLLCVARECPADAVTAPRESFRGTLADSALIVPSPMSATIGRTQDGHESPRCLQNVGPRTYLVVEFDFKRTPQDKLALLSGDTLEAARTVKALLDTGLPSQELCAALGWHLATTHKGRLAAVVSSGGKSLHFWFNVRGVDDTTLERWFRIARRLGADPATFCPCQMVRLPEGRRDNGNLQAVIYLNPTYSNANERKEIDR